MSTLPSRTQVPPRKRLLSLQPTPTYRAISLAQPSSAKEIAVKCVSTPSPAPRRKRKSLIEASELSKPAGTRQSPTTTLFLLNRILPVDLVWDILNLANIPRPLLATRRFHPTIIKAQWRHAWESFTTLTGPALYLRTPPLPRFEGTVCRIDVAARVRDGRAPERFFPGMSDRGWTWLEMGPESGKGRNEVLRTAACVRVVPGSSAATTIHGEWMKPPEHQTLRARVHAADCKWMRCLKEGDRIALWARSDVQRNPVYRTEMVMVTEAEIRVWADW